MLLLLLGLLLLIAAHHPIIKHKNIAGQVIVNGLGQWWMAEGVRGTVMQVRACVCACVRARVLACVHACVPDWASTSMRVLHALAHVHVHGPPSRGKVVHGQPDVCLHASTGAQGRSHG